ncbi:MAG: ATP-dependent DNA helicase RecQ [Proteobacteria bacterium]|nr:MAG: ATP-dependent DNA helicase RecQ [Pseudomonadota bacterium]
MPNQLKDLRATLRKQFHMHDFRPGQKEVINAVMAGKNTLAVLPTGAGKSLCFQLPGLHLPGTTVVVSPLIALMQDQQENLAEYGVEVVAMNSHLSAAEEAVNLRSIKAEKAEFVYVTPERLVNTEFLRALSLNKIDMIVVDEAHCVSQWGHDFRPAYLAIHEAIAALGHPPVLALTATATPEVAADIQKQLRLDQMETFRFSVLRENLILEAMVIDSEAEKAAVAAKLVEEEPGSGILYVSTVKQAVALFESLRAAGQAVELYHGRLAKEQRRAAQEAFMSGKARVMVATNAFGMGIDKPDIRFVLHYNFPASLEAYYQEAGRAGRDGNTARCLLLYLKKDKGVQALFLSRKYPLITDLAALWKFLTALADESGRFSKAGMPKELGSFGARKISLLLTHLKNLGLIEEGRPGVLRLLREDLSEKDLGFFQEEYRARASRDQDKLKAVIQYAQSALCRWHLMGKYFEEEAAPADCGHCDNCRHPVKERLKINA